MLSKSAVCLLSSRIEKGYPISKNKNLKNLFFNGAVAMCRESSHSPRVRNVLYQREQCDTFIFFFFLVQIETQILKLSFNLKLPAVTVVCGWGGWVTERDIGGCSIIWLPVDTNASAAGTHIRHRHRHRHFLLKHTRKQKKNKTAQIVSPPPRTSNNQR